MNIEQYFKRSNFETALSAYYADRGQKWGLSNKLRVYGEAEMAFASELPQQIRTLAFSEVYSAVKAFSAFRKSSGDNWTAIQAQDALSSHCQNVNRASGITLLSNFDADIRQTILTALLPLKDIKPLKYKYPFVPVSKLLHFYNPGLFPMYDEEYIWKKVCRGAFREDYNQFCNNHGYKKTEYGATFNVQYTHWAATIMQDADSHLMKLFNDWFISKVDKSDQDIATALNIHTYYATAFEFVALGAAFVELS